MSKCESNVDELIVPGLVGIPGTVSSRLAEYRDWRGDVQADVSDLETCASNLEIQGLAITAIDFVNPCARYSEVSFKLGDDAVHARLIEPVGRDRASELVPLCLMFHDIDRPVRGWHHMTRFVAMGYAVLALDDETIGSNDLQQGITSPAFVERVRWGCALAKVARNLDGMDPDRIFAWGEGLGGGVALAVSALDEQGFACTALKWPVTPEIMAYGFAFLFDRYRLPLYVTECGLSCNDHIFLDGQVHDADRIDFLHRYLLALCRGCERADVRGFFHWSLTDNFEWHSGYAERIGLIYVDYPTQKRILKDSAHWNAQTARENGRNPELFFVYSGAVSASLVLCSDPNRDPNAKKSGGFIRAGKDTAVRFSERKGAEMARNIR